MAAWDARQSLLSGLTSAIRGKSLDMKAAQKELKAVVGDVNGAVVGGVLQLMLDSLLDAYLKDRSASIGSVPLADFIALLIWTCQEKLIDLVQTLRTLEDLFNALTINHCLDAFKILEEHRDSILDELKTTTNQWGELTLLRFCNDLLRRVSKCSHVDFSGRVLCFLAYMLSTTARSGVNSASMGNVGNKTEYESEEPADSALDVNEGKEDDKEGAEEEKEEGEAVDDDLTSGKRPCIDFEFYTTLWGLQKYVHETDKLTNDDWQKMVHGIEAVLKAFASFCATSEVESATRPFYSTKFLSSSALLKLQLSDSGFRQQLLVQMMVHLHSLQHKVKQKGLKLSEDQLSWVKETMSRLKKILSHTGPNGARFSNTVDLLLNREENWVAWKSTMPKPCPQFEKFWTEGETFDAVAADGPKRFEAAAIDTGVNAGIMAKARGYGAGVVKLDNSIINEHLEKPAMGLKVPSMAEVVEEMVEEDDPEAEIEDEYKLKNHPVYNWRMQRLMAETDLNVMPYVLKEGNVGGAVKYYNKAKETATTASAETTAKKRKSMDE